MAEAIGIDHVYFAVRDLARSRTFYDIAMKALGFRVGGFDLGGDPHVSYTGRYFGVVLRPARIDRPHDPYAPGLHHFCFRVDSADDVDGFAHEVSAAGLEPSPPRLYPEYAPDYYATFLVDPDGLRLEVTNFRRERRERMENWDLPAS